jgi:3-hydroxybutyryl-CoA dehydrogenase
MKKVDPKQIQRVLIVGAGTMGRQIGFQCAAHGYDVVIYDNDKEVLETAIEKIKNYFNDLARSNLIESEIQSKILEKINISDNYEDAGNAVDLLSESIFEDPNIKGETLSEFNKVCPPHTIFTSNTSSLLPSQYAAETGRPSKFAALHFHNPVWYANVVDIMPHAGTDPEIIDHLQEFALSINQTPICLRRENRGYIFNTILDAINRSALRLAANDVASIQDIDRSWMGITKMNVGPFGIMDNIGIDLIYHIMKDSLDQKQLSFIQTFIENGWFGRKSNRGFYAYPNPQFNSPDFIKKRLDNGD